jgi:glucose/arabinose dehydrogenase
VRLRRLALGALVSVALTAGIAAAAGDRERLSAYGFQVVLRELREPVHLAIPRSQPNTMYIVERRGLVRVAVFGKLRPEPFLDLRGKVALNVEQGLLSIAFHPRYATNKRFYVFYTQRRTGAIRIVEYQARGLTALPETARQIAAVSHPGPNHNGGQLAFGPEGRLYFGIGDGGGEGDPHNYAQRLANPYGKLFRIDVNRRRPRARMVGFGLRNPWRFSFDRRTGDLYVGDVGQSAWEEVSFTRRGRAGLENYGWDVYEGRAIYERKQPNPAGRLVMPIAVYPLGGGHCAVTGGFVYRGSRMPALRGRYFYGDYCSGAVWSFRVSGGRAVRHRREPFTVPLLSSFGEGARGELYLASHNGTIYRLGSS